VPFHDLVEEWIALIEEDAGVLGSTEEVLARGGSWRAGRAPTVSGRSWRARLAAGAAPDEAMRGVVRHLIAEFHEDL
jgi:glutamate---cysteine ligase / carboxylate-amine ligase